MTRMRRGVGFLCGACVVTIIAITTSLLPLLVVTADEEDVFIGKPTNYRDDVYHCSDPASTSLATTTTTAVVEGGPVVACNPTTYLWNTNDFNPTVPIDSSAACTDLIDVLVVAMHEQELLQLGPNNNQGNLNANDLLILQQEIVQQWEALMQETTVVEKLEPCVLWAMLYGPLTPYSSSSNSNSSSSSSSSSSIALQQQHQQQHVAIGTSLFVLFCVKAASCSFLTNERTSFLTNERTNSSAFPPSSFPFRQIFY